MEDIFTKKDIADTKGLIKKIDKVIDEQDSDIVEHMGKNANTLLPFDTGMGSTVKDLAKKDPKTFRLLLKSTMLFKNVEDTIFKG